MKDTTIYGKVHWLPTSEITQRRGRIIYMYARLWNKLITPYVVFCMYLCICQNKKFHIKNAKWDRNKSKLRIISMPTSCSCVSIISICSSGYIYVVTWLQMLAIANFIVEFLSINNLVIPHPLLYIHIQLIQCHSTSAQLLCQLSRSTFLYLAV